MRKLGRVALWVLIGIGVLYAGYKVAFPTYTYRYRLTVEVDADGGTRSGASVIEVRLSKQPRFLPEVPGVAEGVSGEAVFVDLGSGRNLIALLASGPNGNDVGFPQHVVPAHFKLSYDDVDLPKFPALQGRWDLPADRMPTLVTFGDLNDPRSARVVPPDAFKEVFGPDVRFKRAFVEMVPAGTWPFRYLGWPSAFAGEPVTSGIEKRMSWLLHTERYRTDPNNPFTNTLAFGLTRFIRER